MKQMSNMAKLQPSIEWKKRYEEVKNLLTSPVNYAKCFEMKEIQGKEIFILDMGEIKCPTGDILVRDPLVWLNRDEKAYLTSVPRGKYRIETLVVIRRRLLQVRTKQSEIYRKRP